MSSPSPLLLLYFSLVLSLARPSLSKPTTFLFANSCPYPIWPATLNNPGSPALSSTGFPLNPGEARSIRVPSPWSGRLWARTGCTTNSSGSFSCITGDCGSHGAECHRAGAVPATLAEFTISGDAGLDFYDVSLVDGSNVPIEVIPRRGKCTTAGCGVDINAICPEALKVTNGKKVVACKSACVAFGSPEFCCTGEFGSASTCRPSNYSMIFKHACPKAYSYAFDDLTSSFTCATGVAHYTISFCHSVSSETSAIAKTRIDRKETPEAHIFKADLPGLKKEEVKVVEVEAGPALKCRWP